MKHLKLDQERMTQYDLEHSGYVMRQLEPHEVEEGMYFAGEPTQIRKVVAISDEPFTVSVMEPLVSVSFEGKQWFYVKSNHS